MGTPLSKPVQRESRIEAVCIGVAVVLAGYGLLDFGAAAMTLATGSSRTLDATLSFHTWYNLLQLAYGLMLALPTWRRSGLCIGEIRRHRGPVLLVCGLPVALTAIVYPQLDEQPFASAGWNFWLIGPPAEELIFSGFLYGRLRLTFTGVLHPRAPIHSALVVTAALFALWHVPMLSESISYGVFQVAYTFVGGVFIGLARQWTGSILYGTLCHMAVNAIACYGGFGG
jgi:membrane protease YdiL (CAAX protease family)